jgi:hypothetical protein
MTIQTVDEDDELIRTSTICAMHDEGIAVANCHGLVYGLNDSVHHTLFRHCCRMFLSSYSIQGTCVLRKSPNTLSRCLQGGDRNIAVGTDKTEGDGGHGLRIRAGNLRRNAEFPVAIQGRALSEEFCKALDGSLTFVSSEPGTWAKLGKRGAFRYLMATAGFRASWASRAATAMSRPEPMISDPPASMDRPGLSCQTM